MTDLTYAFPILPSPEGTGYRLSPGARRIKYGQDYETRVPRSVANTSNRAVTFAWPSLDLASADAMETWMENTRGAQRFRITGTGRDSQFSGWYIYTEMSRNFSKPGYDSVSLSLERVFA